MCDLRGWDWCLELTVIEDGASVKSFEVNFWIVHIEPVKTFFHRHNTFSARNQFFLNC